MHELVQQLATYLKKPTNKRTFNALYWPNFAESAKIEWLATELAALEVEPSLRLLRAQAEFIPYLSTIEQILLPSRLKKMTAKQTLEQLSATCALDLSFCHKETAQLSSYEKLLVQLCQAVMSQQTLLLLVEGIDQLSVFEKQQLLPLLKRIPAYYPCTILLLTGDEQLAYSTYMHQTLSAG